MKIAIFGLGVVGGTLARWLETSTTHTLLKVDPALGLQDDITGAECAFVCVPAATLSDRSQDLSAIEQILEKLPNRLIPVFLKSTVLPGTTDMLSEKYHLTIYHMPEFLTERTRDADFKVHDILVGCAWHESQEKMFQTDFIRAIFPGKRIIPVTNTEAELVKYAHNCFGAVKVNYFNMIYELCQALDCDYENVRRGVLLSGLIESTHTEVPGPDGKFGFGGKCLPKDLKAMIGLTREQWVSNDILFSTEGENERRRKKA